MYAWGDNDLGTLAVGDYSDKNIPTLVKGDINWKSNLGGYRFQVALDENDTPYGWGYRKFGQLGALGKVKGDDIVWDTDLSESNGIVQTLNGEEYIIATEELVNYLDTVLNFEFSGGTSKKGTVQSPSGSTSKFSPKTLDAPSSRKMNVGKWKVKKTKSGFSGKSAIEPGDDSSLKTSETPYSFDIVDVNEVPSSIELSDISSKLTSKGEQFISNIVVTDPDEDDIITVTIPSNSPNASKFEIKNQKLYYDSSTSKANVPYQVIIRATDWEGLSLEVQFEVLVDEDGQLSIEEVITESSSGGGSSYYDARFIDSDGDGFVDADEMATGTDPYDFRSFPTDIDNDGILDFYDGDIDNDGYLNEDDQFPTNPNEWIDADGDGIPDNLDNDDDNDGVVDIDVSWRESYIIQDLFPNDPNESSDFDRDGIGDNSDQDDDNDGVIDSLDAFPFNPYEWMDTDNDSIGDNADEDIDNDGYSNFDEIAIGTNPLDATDFPADQDGDFVPDAIDSDIDGDGISNAFDNAPELYNPDQEFVDDENHYALILPDFFSPNGDGVNDTWVIGEIQRYSTNQVWVYDATGNLVFNQKQYGNDWGGTNDGQVLPKASYLYMIDADGNGTIDYQGWVFITR
jgi:gliding motility-associated-like protein